MHRRAVLWNGGRISFGDRHSPFGPWGESVDNAPGLCRIDRRCRGRVAHRLPPLSRLLPTIPHDPHMFVKHNLQIRSSGWQRTPLLEPTASARESPPTSFPSRSWASRAASVTFSRWFTYRCASPKAVHGHHAALRDIGKPGCRKELQPERRAGARRDPRNRRQGGGSTGPVRRP